MSRPSPFLRCQSLWALVSRLSSPIVDSKPRGRPGASTSSQRPHSASVLVQLPEKQLAEPSSLQNQSGRETLIKAWNMDATKPGQHLKAIRLGGKVIHHEVLFFTSPRCARHKQNLKTRRQAETLEAHQSNAGSGTRIAIDTKPGVKLTFLYTKQMYWKISLLRNSQSRACLIFCS